MTVCADFNSISWCLVRAHKCVRKDFLFEFSQDWIVRRGEERRRRLKPHTAAVILQDRLSDLSFNISFFAIECPCVVFLFMSGKSYLTFTCLNANLGLAIGQNIQCYTMPMMYHPKNNSSI